MILVRTLKYLYLFLQIAVFALSCSKSAGPRDLRGPIDPQAANTACSDMGGKIDQTSKSCLCADGTIAKQSGCAGASGVDVVVGCYQSGGQWDKVSQNCKCPDTSRWNGSQCVDSATDGGREESELGKLLKSTCSQAAGQWWADEEYCACPDGKVLSGNQCIKLDGILTKDVCTKAIRYGAWVGEKCICDEGKFAAPGRGGCVAKPKVSDKVKSHICQSTLNNGIWDPQNSRCNCPQTQKELIWHNELCQDKAQVQPKDLCAGDFNKAVWDVTKSTCKCGLGTIWVNKVCESIQSADPKASCESDANKGKWDEVRRTCLCPGSQGWNAGLKTCSDSGIASWQLLCTQSGGFTGLEVGVCNCGSQFEKKVLLPQKFEYCMPKTPGTGASPRPGSDGGIPDWLKIILGIMK